MLIKELFKLGYNDILTYKSEYLYSINNYIKLSSDSLFFIDAGYKVNGVYLFPLSSPMHSIKGIVLLNEDEHSQLMASSLASKFEIEIIEQPKEVIIKRQYGMRKILQSEFDATRYVLRKGYPDFPSCPYGHTFKMLGYDTETKTYVRLAPRILKDKQLKTLEYKDLK